MATACKTVEFAFPPMASLADATLGTFTQISVYIPEGSPVFKSVVAKVSWDDIVTATGGTITEYRTAIQLAAAGYNTVTNTNDIAHGAENMSVVVSSDHTAYFTTNWTGTSMTCDCQVYVDQTTGTTLGTVNLCCSLEITYEYDDTTTTHVKTVYIPLGAPAGTLATSKPGSATAVIPALDTWLPEASKVYRNFAIFVEGNTQSSAAATDHTVTTQIDTLSSATTGNYEGALQSDRWTRYIFNPPAFDTSVAHDFFVWGSVARFNHLQIWMQVTYEFNSATTTAVMNSLLLPMTFEATSMGGTTSADPVRATLDLWIDEPATIAVQQSALMFFWDCTLTISGINARVGGSGGYTAYTDAGNQYCGNQSAMLRCESAISLARGKNTLIADIYRTDAISFGWGLCGMWMLNYTSGKAAGGVSTHNRTVKWTLATFGTGAPANVMTTAGIAVTIPEANYFVNNHGFEMMFFLGTGNAQVLQSLSILLERLSGEGGVSWEPISLAEHESDSVPGTRFTYANPVKFKRWPGDINGARVDIETARRYRTQFSGRSITFFVHLAAWITYHAITFSASGSVSGSGGGTVNLALHWVDASGNPKEQLAVANRSGDGSYAFTWYDNVSPVVVTAREDDTHVGMSAAAVAA